MFITLIQKVSSSIFGITITFSRDVITPTFTTSTSSLNIISKTWNYDSMVRTEKSLNHDSILLGFEFRLNFQKTYKINFNLNHNLSLAASKFSNPLKNSTSSHISLKKSIQKFSKNPFHLTVDIFLPPEWRRDHSWLMGGCAGCCGGSVRPLPHISHLLPKLEPCLSLICVYCLTSTLDFGYIFRNDGVWRSSIIISLIVSSFFDLNFKWFAALDNWRKW